MAAQFVLAVGVVVWHSKDRTRFHVGPAEGSGRLAAQPKFAVDIHPLPGSRLCRRDGRVLGQHPAPFWPTTSSRWFLMSSPNLGWTREPVVVFSFVLSVPKFT